jgi:hypothetical protein
MTKPRKQSERKSESKRIMTTSRKKGSDAGKYSIRQTSRKHTSMTSRVVMIYNQMTKYTKKNGWRSSLREVFFNDSQDLLKMFRFVLIAMVAAFFGVLAAIMLRLAHASSEIAMIFGLAVALIISLVGACGFTWPLQTRRFVSVNKHAFFAAGICLAFFGLGIATQLQGFGLSKTRGLAITYDEVSFIPSGYYYQSNGKNFLSPDHPPLVKDVGAIPLSLMNLKQASGFCTASMGKGILI